MPSRTEGPGTRRWVGLAVVVLAAVVLALWLANTGSASARIPSSAEPSARMTTTTTTASGATTATTAKTSSGATITWVEQDMRMTFDGLDRSYLVFRPAGTPSGQLPVLVELEGCCNSGPIYEANRANFRHVAGPAILVYPAPVGGDWDAGACCRSASADKINDVGFVEAVIARVRADQPDASQGAVYLAGYSNGGKLAMLMACDDPSEFAGVAVYGATRTANCNGPPAESVLLMAGTADPEDAVSGKPVVEQGYTEPTVDQLLDSYLAADGCTASTRTVTAGTATESLHDDCAKATSVGEVLYSGENHTWPEGGGGTPSAQKVMWDWFVQLGA